MLANDALFVDPPLSLSYFFEASDTAGGGGVTSPGEDLDYDGIPAFSIFLSFFGSLSNGN